MPCNPGCKTSQQPHSPATKITGVSVHAVDKAQSQGLSPRPLPTLASGHRPQPTERADDAAVRAGHFKDRDLPSSLRQRNALRTSASVARRNLLSGKRARGRCQRGSTCRCQERTSHDDSCHCPTPVRIPRRSSRTHGQRSNHSTTHRGWTPPGLPRRTQSGQSQTRRRRQADGPHPHDVDKARHPPTSR